MTNQMSKGIRVQYYAVLREQRGASEETVLTGAPTARAFYQELGEKHGFTLEPDMLRVVINEEFSEWDAPINDGDTIVFIPPIAGG